MEQTVFGNNKESDGTIRIQEGFVAMRSIDKKGTVYVLMSCYKDNDDEVVGVFESMESLLAYFARMLMADHKEDDPSDVVELVARLTADLVGRGCDDECVDGRTRYWYCDYELLGFKKDEGVNE